MRGIRCGSVAKSTSRYVAISIMCCGVMRASSSASCSGGGSDGCGQQRAASEVDGCRSAALHCAAQSGGVHLVRRARARARRRLPVGPADPIQSPCWPSFSHARQPCSTQDPLCTALPKKPCSRLRRVISLRGDTHTLILDTEVERRVIILERVLPSGLVSQGVVKVHASVTRRDLFPILCQARRSCTTNGTNCHGEESARAERAYEAAVR